MINGMRKMMMQALGLLPMTGCDSSAERKVSDHFDGKKFFNPTLRNQFSPSFSDIVRMIREGRVKWPESVDNSSVPRLNESLGPDDISLTFVNHATFLVQLPGLNTLTDPVWSERASPFRWIGPKRVRAPGLALDELPEIDVIIISHNHYDHLDTDTLKKIIVRFSPLVLVPLGDKALVESIGATNVRELDWWEGVAIDVDTQVTFTPTQHSSARGLFDRDRSLWGSYFIRYRSRSVYFGGDAGYSAHFAETKKRLGPPEIALLGIGAYAPRFFMKPIHMAPDEAVLAHRDLGAKLSVGMHFGTFQLASEGFDQPLEDLKIAMEKQNVSQSEFITLLEGEERLFRDTWL